MKFGPVAPADALGATAVHSIRQGDLVLKKGTLIGPAEVAALKAAGVKEIVVARLEPGDVSEDQAAADIAAAVAGEGVRADRAFTGRCNLFAESVRRAGARQGRDRPAQPHRRGGDAGDAAGVQAGGGRRDDRHREDHSLRGRRRRARQSGGGSDKGQAGDPRRALHGAQDRHRLDAAAGPFAESRRQDPQDHRDAHCAGRRYHRCRAARAARAAGARARHRRGAQSRRRTGDRVRRLGHRRPPRRHPGGDRGGRRRDRAFRHAGRSRQSDADRPPARAGGDRRARLRALAEGKRLRLGADAAARRPAGDAARTSPAWASAAC